MVLGGNKMKKKSGKFLGFLPPSKNSENLFSIFLKIHKHKVGSSVELLDWGKHPKYCDWSPGAVFS